MNDEANHLRRIADTISEEYVYTEVEADIASLRKFAELIDSLSADNERLRKDNERLGEILECYQIARAALNQET